MKNKFISILSVFIWLTACQKQEIQLPLINSSGLSEIQNHSSIWIFRDSTEAGITPRLNKNNKIINTHWIFNIDKRLPMKDVVPLLIKMQENKNKPSMHKKGELESYFSYANLYDQKISLLPFPQINFHSLDRDTVDDEFKLKKTASWILQLNNENLRLNDQIVSKDSIKEILDQEKTLSPVEQEGKETPFLLLITDGETSYQNYLSLKAFLHENEIAVTSDEYLLTVK